PGPGVDFFNVVQESLGNLPIIAEDLGVITPDVVALRDQFGLPGMKILQFAFSGPDNLFLPHSYPRNCVVYTGTHDNDTTRGWYESAPENEKDFARRYLGSPESLTSDAFTEKLIRAAWASVATFALAPLQDFINLDTKARMNYPSQLGGNWEWRMTEDAMSGKLLDRLKELNCLYQR
ncbi:MAG: 4-alpha-glucanotransferase, partial [Chloroflexota bacterium]